MELISNHNSKNNNNSVNKYNYNNYVSVEFISADSIFIREGYFHVATSVFPILNI
jgi:hypothetical protein